MNIGSAIAWSFPSKHKQGELERSRCCTPGPGNYNDEKSGKVNNKSISYSFGRGSKEQNNRTKTPGPGFYVKSNESLFGKSTPKFSMGKTERKEINLDDNSIRVGPKNITPGPGQYLIDISVMDKTKKKYPGFKIGKTTKEINYNNNIPGPGAYTQEKNNTFTKSPGWKIGTSKKDDTFVSTKGIVPSPGPGRYLEKSEFDLTTKKGFKFGNDPKMKSQKSITPGPGNYYLPCAISNVPKYSVGKFDKNYNWV